MRAAVIGQGPVGRFLAQRFDVQALGRDETPSTDLDVVFLAVPDDAIAHLASSLRSQGSWALVHCSGACPLSALSSGAGAVWHPMSAFTRSSAVPDDLGGAVVGLRGDDTLVTWLEAQTLSWGGQPVRIDEDQAILIHAACCFAAGFTASVAVHAQRLMESAGLTPNQTQAAVARLSSGAIEQALQGAGLTGPAVRGDLSTVRAHLDALGSLAALYRQLSLSIAAHQPLDARIEEHLKSVD